MCVSLSLFLLSNVTLSFEEIDHVDRDDDYEDVVLKMSFFSSFASLSSFLDGDRDRQKDVDSSSSRYIG